MGEPCPDAMTIKAMQAKNVKITIDKPEVPAISNEVKTLLRNKQDKRSAKNDCSHPILLVVTLPDWLRREKISGAGSMQGSRHHPADFTCAGDSPRTCTRSLPVFLHQNVVQPRPL